MGKKTIGGIGILVLALGMGTPSSAHVKKFPSSVVITRAALSPTAASDVKLQGAAEYGGKVRSKRKACRKDRRVRVYHEIKGPDPVIGGGKTRPGGNWEIHGSAPPDGDLVYAIVARKVLRSASGHRHVCKAARSHYVVFPLIPKP